MAARFFGRNEGHIAESPMEHGQNNFNSLVGNVIWSPTQAQQRGLNEPPVSTGGAMISKSRSHWGELTEVPTLAKSGQMWATCVLLDERRVQRKSGRLVISSRCVANNQGYGVGMIALTCDE